MHWGIQRSQKDGKESSLQLLQTSSKQGFRNLIHYIQQKSKYFRWRMGFRRTMILLPNIMKNGPILPICFATAAQVQSRHMFTFAEHAKERNFGIIKRKIYPKKHAVSLTEVNTINTRPYLYAQDV
jgi:hypothetical protein